MYSPWRWVFVVVVVAGLCQGPSSFATVVRELSPHHAVLEDACLSHVDGSVLVYPPGTDGEGTPRLRQDEVTGIKVGCEETKRGGTRVPSAQLQTPACLCALLLLR